MSFGDDLTEIPADRVSSGFVEIGEFQTDEFEFETDIAMGVAPDGSVWAKICDSVDELPLSPERKAWDILAEAEEAFGAKSMAEDRAACGNWPAPKEIGDYMMWIKDEAEVQECQFADNPGETERGPYAAVLRGIHHELCLLGFSAIRPLWEKK